jgi:DNA-binding Lrp family transcriptional regulator
MKENTKYQNYRFRGKISVNEIEPWFDFGTAQPWDDLEVPWVLDNKVRREILIILAKSPKTFEELYENLNFSPKPLLISKEEYDCKIKYQWTKETIKNHLLNLEWYNLVELQGDKYIVTFPIFTMENLNDVEEYVLKFAESWVKVINDTKEEVKKKLNIYGKKNNLYGILIEKALEKLYELLKNQNLLPDEPNIKVLWAEQLRKIKFEDWVEKNF